MTRSIILSIVPTVAVFIGFLLLFPAIWVVTIFVLLGLVTAQVVLVRRHLRVVAPWELGADLPVPADIGGARESGETALGAAVGDTAATHGSAAPSIDSDVFNRFREQLESAEKSIPAAAAARSAASPPATPEDVQDRVQLSSSARERGVTVRALHEPHPAERDAPDEDIFSDLRTDPGRLTSPTAKPVRPPMTSRDDLLEVLDEPTADTTPEDNTTLLKLIEDALARQDLDGARAGLQNYFAAMGAAPQAVSWRAHRATMHLAALERQPAKVTEAFELMLKAGYVLAEESFEALLDDLLRGMAPGDAGPLRVSLLVRALGEFRQQNDRPAMDRLYRRIEEVQAGIGDEEKLVRFLKNHLEIKKVMQDLPGQLDIVDQIGNRLYRMGQTDEAREYYEQGLKMREELETQEAAGEEAAPAAVPAATDESPAADHLAEAAAPGEKPAPAEAAASTPGGEPAPAEAAASTPGDDAPAEDAPPDEPRQRRGE